MKGITPVISVILLTLIGIALAGATYVAYTGINDATIKASEAKAASSFKIVSTSENKVYLKNTGSEYIQAPVFFIDGGAVSATSDCGETIEPGKICGYDLGVGIGVHEVVIGGEESDKKTVLYVGVEKPAIDVPITIARPPTVVSPPRVITTTTVPGSVTTTTLPLPHRRVFVSSGTYKGNLGGLAGGDAKCQSMADAAGLGGIWKVWLSDSTTNAIDRIPDAAYTDVCGNVLINGKSDIADGEITGAIRRAENRYYMWEYTYVLTGTENNGMKTIKTCNDWTDSTHHYGATLGQALDNAAWSGGDAASCSASVTHLYCFETEPPATPPVMQSCPATLPDKRVFVSSATYNGNLGGLEGGDAKCQALADAAGIGGSWVAWLSDSTTNAIDRIDDAVYRHVLAGGVASAGVAISGKDDLSDGTLTYRIRYDENGDLTSLRTRVYTGTDDDGTKMPDTCNEWTTSDSLIVATSGYISSTTDWSSSIAIGMRYCNSNLPIYCFEKGTTTTIALVSACGDSDGGPFDVGDRVVFNKGLNTESAGIIRTVVGFASNPSYYEYVIAFDTGYYAGITAQRSPEGLECAQ